MAGIPVSLGIHRHSLNAHFAGGEDDTAGDFTPICDQYLITVSYTHLEVYKRQGESAKKLEIKAEMKLADLAHHSQHTDPVFLDKKRAVIEAALARARAKRLTDTPPQP